jgi:hypothetical protein
LKTLALHAIFFAFLVMPMAHAQQFDVAFGVNGISAPSASSASGNYSPQSLAGGAYPTFSGDFLLFHNFGVNGEVSWRASRGLYAGFFPYRPVFYDFNGVWAPRLGRVGAELMAGIGAESIRFYQPTFVCGFGGCTNYSSSNHFLGHFAGGLRFYPTKNIFVRPEAHLFLIHNNVEFSSFRAVRYGLSIGYTFAGEPKF